MKLLRSLAALFAGCAVFHGAISDAWAATWQIDIQHDSTAISIISQIPHKEIQKTKRFLPLYLKKYQNSIKTNINIVDAIIAPPNRATESLLLKLGIPIITDIPPVVFLILKR